MSDIEKELKIIPFTARSFREMDSVVDFEVYKEKVSLALDEIKKLQAENAELKALNSTQENLLRASIDWMDQKGCPVPYDFRVAFETPQKGE